MARYLFLILLFICSFAFPVKAEVVPKKNNVKLPIKNLQSPFNETELKKFIKDWPAFFKIINAPSKEQNIKKEIEKMGWKSDRFFYVMEKVTYGVLMSHLENNHKRTVAEIKAKKEEIIQSPELKTTEKKKILRELNSSISKAERIKKQMSPLPSEMKIINKHIEELADTIYSRLTE